MVTNEIFHAIMKERSLAHAKETFPMHGSVSGVEGNRWIPRRCGRQEPIVHGGKLAPERCYQPLSIACVKNGGGGLYLWCRSCRPPSLVLFGNPTFSR